MSRKGAIKASVHIEFEDIEPILDEFNAFIDENCLEVAQECAVIAKSLIKDKTGNLSKGVKARKSKFEDGGAIAIATAPHAYLVEFGHALVRGGKVIGQVPPHPFLRPAKEKVIQSMIAKFGAKG